MQICDNCFNDEEMQIAVRNDSLGEGVCDACGNPTVLRDDDKPETVLKRLSVYHAETQPVSAYYVGEHKYFYINSNINPDYTFAQIQTIVKLLN